jgi:acetyl esterase
MKWIKVVFKNVFLTGTLLCSLMIIAVLISIHMWQSTEEGRLPAKTAVVLHAINNNLVDLNVDIHVPEIVSGGSGNEPYLIKNEMTIPLEDNEDIPVRIYRPRGEGPFPITLYYHGGAFMKGYGGLETHDNIIRSIASKTDNVVIAPAYRLAPEHIFPAAVEDSYKALLWAEKHADMLGGDKERISVMGDSAGGNIATVVSQMARDRKGPDLAAQVLFYPITTFQEIPLNSRETYDSGYYLLSKSIMYQARESYTPQPTMWAHPYTSPLQAENLNDLPPALIITAEFDPLRDEGESYARKLHEAGVPVHATRYRGVMHGFVSFYEVMQSGRNGMDEAVVFLRDVQNGNVDQNQEFIVHVEHQPQGWKRMRDQTEAFAIAAYLIGRTGTELLIEEYSFK